MNEFRKIKLCAIFRNYSIHAREDSLSIVIKIHKLENNSEETSHIETQLEKYIYSCVCVRVCM